MKLARTGKKIPFLDLPIGASFFAHGRYWVRHDYDSATSLGGSDGPRSACDFLIDGTVRSERSPVGHPGQVCEEVETVEAAFDAVLEPQAA